MTEGLTGLRNHSVSGPQTTRVPAHETRVGMAAPPPDPAHEISHEASLLLSHLLA